MRTSFPRACARSREATATRCGKDTDFLSTQKVGEFQEGARSELGDRRKLERPRFGLHHPHGNLQRHPGRVHDDECSIPQARLADDLERLPVERMKRVVNRRFQTYGLLACDP